MYAQFDLKTTQNIIEKVRKKKIHNTFFKMKLEYNMGILMFFKRDAAKMG